MKITKLLEFFVYNNPGISWKGTLRPPSLSTNRTWELPDRDGTLWLNTDTVTIPWTTQFEYSTPGVSVWRTIPAGSRYVSGVVIGAGGGSGSGARGNTNANRTGGSSGSAGGVTPFTFDLQSIATMCGCFLSALQYEEVVGAAGVSGAAITTDNTDGANGASGGISSIRFRATPGQGFATIFLGCRAVGGAGGLGGRRGATVTTGGAVQSLGATFPGQIGTAGRSTTGNQRSMLTG